MRGELTAGKSVADPVPYAGEDVSTEGWTTVKLPGLVNQFLTLPKAGAIWLRKEINVSPRPRIIFFSNFRSMASTTFIGTASWSNTCLIRIFPGTGYAKYYVLPSELVHVGKNILAIRIYEPVGPAKFNSGILASRQPLFHQWRPAGQGGVCFCRFGRSENIRSPTLQLLKRPPHRHKWWLDISLTVMVRPLSAICDSWCDLASAMKPTQVAPIITAPLSPC